MLFQSANRSMTEAVKNLLARGLATSVNEATELVCRLYGQDLAKQLEENLRMLGAKNFRVTCP